MAPYCGNAEPTIDELLDDHIVRLLMARDLLTADEVRACVEATRQRLRARREPPWRVRRA